jgi:cyclopropane fatty-acyl-phospholipid synthase-like methyltransferase
MKHELIKQREYWNRELANFDAIYSHRKSKISNWVDSLLRWDMYERFNYAMRNSEPIENRTFLDVGCGTGLYSIELAKRGAAKVVGLDISENMIDVCNQRASKENLDETTSFHHTDLFKFDSNSTFDVSIGIGLFDYVREPLPLLQKMKERTSDRAILSFPRAGTMRAFIRKIRLSLRSCEVYFYSKSQIDQLLRQAGFHRHEMEKIGQLFCVTAHIQ